MRIRIKLLILLGLTFTACLCHAQYRPKFADQYLKRLQRQGVDTILVYMTGCSLCSVTSTPNCNCSLGDIINSFYIIYKKGGKINKINLSCCREDTLTNNLQNESIPYFLPLKTMFNKKRAFYKDLSKNKKFIAPIPTDTPFDDVELIIGKKHINFTSYDYQRNTGYRIWKGYFWIDKELKLVDLIRSDLSLSKL